MEICVDRHIDAPQVRPRGVAHAADPRPGSPVAWQRSRQRASLCLCHSTKLPTPSIDRAPSPTIRNRTKLSKNIEQD